MYLRYPAWVPIPINLAPNHKGKLTIKNGYRIHVKLPIHEETGVDIDVIEILEDLGEDFREEPAFSYVHEK